MLFMKGLALGAIMKPLERPIGCAAGATKSKRRRGPKDRSHLRSMSSTTPNGRISSETWGQDEGGAKIKGAVMCTHHHTHIVAYTGAYLPSELETSNPPTSPIARESAPSQERVPSRPSIGAPPNPDAGRGNSFARAPTHHDPHGGHCRGRYGASPPVWCPDTPRLHAPGGRCSSQR